MNYLKLPDKNLLKVVLSFAKKKRKKVYLVGGYPRDIILKRRKANPDMDFCLKNGAINFSRSLAKEMKAGFVVLDKEHGCGRLVKRLNNAMFTLDFSDFRGRDIKQDLFGRDFTINAAAVELESVFSPDKFDNLLIDPYAAKKDLKLKIIRLVNNKGFDQDPLRILRAFSLAAIFGFKIEKQTLGLIKKKKGKLSRVSFERVRDELFKILDRPDSFAYLSELDRLGILKLIIPEIELMRGVRQGPYHHLDIWRHSLETVRQLEIAMQEFNRNKDIVDYLAQVFCAERRRYALIKLGALLHDIGKPGALFRQDGKIKFYGHEKLGCDISRDIVRRLKLSNDELNALSKMVFWHLRPGYLADNQFLSRRAKFRYFRDTADEAISVLLISLADQRSTKGRLTTRASRLRHEKAVSGLIREYFKKKKEKNLPRLVNGDDLIKKFKLEPSPLIGEILSAIEESQAIGKIKTKQGAIKAARKFIMTRKQ